MSEDEKKGSATLTDIINILKWDYVSSLDIPGEVHRKYLDEDCRYTLGGWASSKVSGLEKKVDTSSFRFLRKIAWAAGTATGYILAPITYLVYGAIVLDNYSRRTVLK